METTKRAPQYNGILGGLDVILSKGIQVLNVGTTGTIGTASSAMEDNA
jgi:hypothetical protein